MSVRFFEDEQAEKIIQKHFLSLIHISEPTRQAEKLQLDNCYEGSVSVTETRCRDAIRCRKKDAMSAILLGNGEHTKYK